MSKNNSRAVSVTMRSALSLIAGIGMLVVSGLAQAKDDDAEAKTCNNATLNGLYAFHASGFNIVGGAPGVPKTAEPKAIVELIRFNGDGTLVVPAATVSINGVVSRSPAGGGGSYVVTAGCIGSLAFGPPGGPTFDFFIGLKESELHMIQTNQGTVLQGTAELVSR
jgi:hypothetical protein